MAAEDEAKPPAKADQDAGGGRSRTGGRGGSGRAFKAPTPNHENDYFDWSSYGSKTVKHLKTIEKLANYIGTNFGTYASTAAAAVRSREAPVFTEPVKPKQEDGADRDLYEMEKDAWRDEFKEYRKAKRAWENENNPRIYNLLISHCTPEMVSKLKG